MVALLVAGSARAEFGRETPDEYWSLSEFFENQPAQRALTKRFSERVANAAMPIEAPSDPVRIAIVYPAIQASDYWRRSIVALEARLDELGISYELTSQFTQPGQEIREQTRQVAEALKSDPDYLVFTLDALRHRVIVERLIARDRPKVILQNITTPLRIWGNEQPFLYVGFDHASGTRFLAEYILHTRPQPEPYAIFYGPKGLVSQTRGEPFRLAMVERSRKRLVASYYVGFDRERARQTAMTLLARQPDIGFIFSCSTDIALGVSDAITEMGLDGSVSTNGWGGGSAELEQLGNGRLAVTVMRMNDDNGVAIAEAIALDLQGRSSDVPLVYSGAFELVPADTDRARMEALKRRAFRYSR
ncbi:autoinducer 2-binding periplasmic protein LuxP [Stappia sp.]|uniref:autoinducer 2-binding periplasmic protein LuxP n=1 Tax=Stappia sp. TaxID=1870903 RepID=UPI003A996F7B